MTRRNDAQGTDKHSTAPRPVLNVNDLSVQLTRQGQREPVQALEGISLEVGRGEILALVGESGSGKSVLGLAALGLLPALSRPVVHGTLKVDGVDVVTATAGQLRNLRRDSLGVVFQDPMTSLNPTMRIGRQVTEVTIDRRATVDVLAQVGIPDPADRLAAFPHQLSGGLRQRVMIAMAIAKRPSLIIADEPTTALDVTVQKRILNVIRELRDTYDCGVLFITHDLGVADELADRIAVIRKGRIVENGTPSRVLTRPAHEYTRSLVASRLTLSTPRHTEAEPRASLTMPPAEEADITVVEATKTFGRGRRARRALDGVSLTVHSQESVAIVGESGSGKSTLLRLIAGLDRPDAGCQPIVRTGDRLPQMVFQDAGSSLTPWLTVGEILNERLRAGKVPAAERATRVDEVLEQVGLDASVRRARTRELSGGQRQRVVIARAILLPPRTLLCDEPTSALDAKLASTSIALIKRVQRQTGMSMVFVTHDLAVAKAVSDRLYVMKDGRIVEEGPTDWVLRHPATDYTRELIAAVPGTRREVEPS